MLESLLNRKKEEIKKLKAPDNMEDKLREALHKDDSKKNISKFKILKIASVFLVLSIAFMINSYSIANILTNVDKEVIEEYRDITYENIEEKNLAIQKLSEEINIGETKVLIDGVLASKEGLILFYKTNNGDNISVNIENGKNRLEKHSSQSIPFENNIMKVVEKFTGKINSKKLIVSLNDGKDFKSIDIELDEEKIIKDIEKIKVNKGYKYDGNNYNIKEIIITPISIKVKGQNENLFTLAIRSIFNIRKDYSDVDLILIVNGKEQEWNSLSKTSDFRGSTFEYEFENKEKVVNNLSIEFIDGLIKNKLYILSIK